MNLVTRREAGGEAIGGPSPNGRHLFLVPWRGRALFGTWESPRACGADRRAGERSPLEVDEAEVVGFIGEINHAFPSLDLTLADVTLVHRGIVPAIVHADGTATLAGRDQIHDHAAHGVQGLMSVAGTKYTTARAVAERVTDRILAKLRRPPVASRTTDALPGGERATLGDPAVALEEARRLFDARVPSDTLPHLVAAYGSRHVAIAELAAERLEWGSRVGDRSPVIGAELVWAARHEMVLTLNDAVVRRTPLGALGHPGDQAAEQAARIVGAELGWSAERTQTELDALQRFYRIS
jgi:glycerol-3-phosphate dehydrogenase